MMTRILLVLVALLWASSAAAQNTTVPGYPEDTPTVNGERLTMIGVRRCDTTPTSSSGTAADRSSICADANGRVYVNATLYDAAGTALTSDTQATHDTTLGTITSVTGGLVMGRASAAAPTDVSADGDAVIPWYLRSGALSIQPTFAGVLGVAGNGASGTGVQRVTLANDSTGVLATVSTVTSVSQFGGVAVPVEDSAETANGTGIYAMTVRRDAAASSAGTTGDNATANTDANGLLWTRTFDPCSAKAKTTTPISLTTDTVIIAASASNKTYICSISIVAGAAEIVSITEGTGSVCATSEAALAGSTTDANGMSFAANGGFAAIGGTASVMVTAGTNVDTCMNVSGSNRVSGFVTWVQAP